MSAGWVAATVRARAMARRRVGTRRIRQIAETSTLDAGLAGLAGTAYERAATPGTRLVTAEHEIRAEQLWELRVLAGWLPAAGIPLIRALAARYELANIEHHHARLTGRDSPPAFALGTLATSWPRLAATTSLEELRGELGASRWGDPGGSGSDAMHDALYLSWLRMMAGAAGTISGVRRWTAGAAALIVARGLTAPLQAPPGLLATVAMPLLGHQWPRADSIAELRALLPGTARWALDEVDDPAQLWRAEARLRGHVEAGGFQMLRARPGPEPVLGAVAVLAADAWRVRAALACAAIGTGESEVLDVVA